MKVCTDVLGHAQATDVLSCSSSCSRGIPTDSNSSCPEAGRGEAKGGWIQGDRTRGDWGRPMAGLPHWYQNSEEEVPTVPPDLSS